MPPAASGIAREVEVEAAAEAEAAPILLGCHLLPSGPARQQEEAEVAEKTH